ncbi:MAG: elongator complex protein 3 [Thermodesulfobacteriota bacterium]
MVFSCKPFVVPIFIPHSGCPHRCVFCNQEALAGTETAMPAPSAISAEIARFLAFRKKNRHPVEISFYGGNFLGLDAALVKTLLETAAAFVEAGKADGIRFSTRPDTIDDQRLAAISAFPVTTVELGVQSMDDAVLSRTRRGHSADDTRQAVSLLKARGWQTGLQMMVGLPGESRQTTRTTGRAVAALAPDFVRIYPTLVLRGSRLAMWYEAGTYKPLEMADCIDRLKALYRMFTGAGIPVIRMGVQPNEGIDSGDDVLAGPYHPALGHRVKSEHFFDVAADAIEALPQQPARLALCVAPRQVSAMRGLKNENIERLHRRFAAIDDFDVKADAAVGEMNVKVSVGS